MSDTTKSAPLAPLPAPQPEAPPPPLVWWRKLLVALIVLGVLSAMAVGVLRLRGGTDVNTGPSPTPSPSAATTTVVAEQPPPLLNTGTGDNINWDEMVRSIYTYQKWLYDHRRPELLRNEVREENPDYQTNLLGLTNLASHPDWHYDPAVPPVEVRSAQLSSRPASDKAVIRVQFGPVPRNRVVDGGGTVIFDDPPHPAATVMWTMQQDAGSSRWRLAKVEPQ